MTRPYRFGDPKPIAANKQSQLRAWRAHRAAQLRVIGEGPAALVGALRAAGFQVEQMPLEEAPAEPAPIAGGPLKH